MSALLTSFTSLGGYPMPPRSWMWLSSGFIFQLLSMTILIWQSKHVNLVASILIAIIFLHILYIWNQLDEKILPKLLPEHYSNPRYFAGAVPVTFR